MQNELLEPPLSQGIMQHVTLPSQPMSGPLSQTPSSVADGEQSDPNRARKVAEVFLTAGHAFQKLGDLAMQLHMSPSSVPTEERWSENNVDHLREALTRFAHELDQISNNVQARTAKMISTDIRRRHMTPQRPIPSTSISTLKRQPAKLGPVIVPKRMNVTRSTTRQYMPARLAPSPAVPQVIVPTTKTYPMTRPSGSVTECDDGDASNADSRSYARSKLRNGHLPSRSTDVGSGDVGGHAAAVGSTHMTLIFGFLLIWIQIMLIRCFYSSTGDVQRVLPVLG
ncbi:hypothetical protein Q1695_016038 [Nippostrongylus brasiliensis]|nr:hypothetical protein Q1695_016038 [Nippostrongylus brasiliensis]